MTFAHFYYHRISPRIVEPKLGHNFVADEQVNQRIADASGDLAGRTVAERGISSLSEISGVPVEGQIL